MGKVSQARIKQIIREEILKKNNNKNSVNETTFKSSAKQLRELQTILGTKGCNNIVVSGKFTKNTQTCLIDLITKHYKTHDIKGMPELKDIVGASGNPDSAQWSPDKPFAAVKLGYEDATSRRTLWNSFVQFIKADFGPNPESKDKNIVTMRSAWEAAHAGVESTGYEVGGESDHAKNAINLGNIIVEELDKESLDQAIAYAAKQLDERFETLAMGLEVHKNNLVRLQDFPTSTRDTKETWQILDSIASGPGPGAGSGADPTLLRLRLLNGMYAKDEWDSDTQAILAPILVIMGVIGAAYLAAPFAIGASVTAGSTGATVGLATKSATWVGMGLLRALAAVGVEAGVMKVAAIGGSAALGSTLGLVAMQVSDKWKSILSSQYDTDLKDAIDRTKFWDDDAERRWQPVNDAMSAALGQLIKYAPTLSGEGSSGAGYQKVNFLKDLRTGISPGTLTMLQAKRVGVKTGKAPTRESIAKIRIRNLVRSTIISEAFGISSDELYPDGDPPPQISEEPPDPEVEPRRTIKTNKIPRRGSSTVVQQIKAILNKLTASTLDVNNKKWGKRDGETDQAWWKFVDMMWSDKFGDKSSVVNKYWVDVAKTTGKGYSPTPSGAMEFMSDLISEKEGKDTTTVARVDTPPPGRVPEYEQGSVHQRTRDRDYTFIGKQPTVNVIGIESAAISQEERKQIGDFFRVLADDMQIGQFTVQVVQRGNGEFRIEDNTTVIRGTGRPLLKVRGRSGGKRQQQLSKLIKKFSKEKIGIKKGQIKGKNFMISIKRGGHQISATPPPTAAKVPQAKPEASGNVATVGKDSVTIEGMNISITNDKNLKINSSVYSVKGSVGMSVPFEKIEKLSVAGDTIMRVSALGSTLDFSSPEVLAISNGVEGGGPSFDVKLKNRTVKFTKV